MFDSVNTQSNNKFDSGNTLSNNISRQYHGFSD